MRRWPAVIVHASYGPLYNGIIAQLHAVIAEVGHWLLNTAYRLGIPRPHKYLQSTNMQRRTK